MLSQLRWDFSRGLQAAAGALVLLGALGWVSAASAGTIVKDKWADGNDSTPASPTFSENGTDTDLDGDKESAWFFGGSTTLDPVGLGGPQRGTVADASASWTTYFTPEGSEVTLGQGHSIRVTWVFTPTGVNTTNGSQNFRIALVDSPVGSRITANNNSPGSAAFNGYGLFANFGQTLGHASSFRLMERTAAAGAFLGTSSDWTSIGVTGATNGNHGYDNNTEYVFDMKITRTLLDQLQIDMTMKGGTLDGDGLASVSFLDTTPNNSSFKFDTFGIRPTNAATTATQFDTRLFRVAYIVPEPASFALLSLASLALALAARRKR